VHNLHANFLFQPTVLQATLAMTSEIFEVAIILIQAL